MPPSDSGGVVAVLALEHAQRKNTTGHRAGGPMSGRVESASRTPFAGGTLGPVGGVQGGDCPARPECGDLVVEPATRPAGSILWAPATVPAGTVLCALATHPWRPMCAWPQRHPAHSGADLGQENSPPRLLGRILI